MFNAVRNYVYITYIDEETILSIDPVSPLSDPVLVTEEGFQLLKNKGWEVKLSSLTKDEAMVMMPLPNIN